MIQNNVLPFRFYCLPDELTEVFKNGNDREMHDFLGLILCDKGSMTIVFHGEEYVIGPNCVFVVHVNANLKIQGMTSDFNGVMIAAQPDYALRVAEKAMDVSLQLYYTNNPLIQYTGEEYSNVVEQFDSLKREMDVMLTSEHDPDALKLVAEIVRCQVEKIIYKGMYIILKRNSTLGVNISKGNEVVKRFMVSVDKNHRLHRDVSFYAREQFMTSNYFSTVIKKGTGISALQCIAMAVVNDAKQLLCSSNMSVKEISSILGFSSQSFFGKYFKLYAGVTPRSYRMNHIGK